MESIGPSSSRPAADRAVGSSVSGAAEQGSQPQAGRLPQQAELLAAAGAAEGIACITPPGVPGGSLHGPSNRLPRSDEPRGMPQQQDRRGNSSGRSAVGAAGSPAAPAASGGSSSSNTMERGVYSFCMCPGGQASQDVTPLILRTRLGNRGSSQSVGLISPLTSTINSAMQGNHQQTHLCLCVPTYRLFQQAPMRRSCVSMG